MQRASNGCKQWVAAEKQSVINGWRKGREQINTSDEFRHVADVYTTSQHTNAHLNLPGSESVIVVARRWT